MKAILGFLILFPNVLMSQVNFTNYLDSTSVWHEYYSDVHGLGYQIKYNTIYFDGDTLINGNHYYKMYQTTYDTSHTYWGNYTVVDTFQIGPFFIREDNTLKFYKYYPQVNQEIVEYDWQWYLNSQIGDTFPNIQMVCTIDTIATVQFGNQVLGKYIGDGNFNMPNYVVEGIGNIGIPCGIGHHTNSWIVCYKKQNDSLQFDNKDCGLFPVPIRTSHFTVSTTSVDQLNQVFFRLFPNPMEQLLKISSLNNQVINQVVVHDIAGSVVLDFTCASSEITINTEELPKGMYIVHLIGNGEDEYHKIMKF